MTDLTAKTAEELKALVDAADIVEFVLGGIWSEDDDAYAPAAALLVDAGFAGEDAQDAIDFGQSVKDEISRREREEFYAKGPRAYSEDELFNMLQSAAHRAYHVNAKPATDQQCRYLAKLVAQSGGRDPMGGNTNDVLTSKRAHFMIEDYRR